MSISNFLLFVSIVIPAIFSVFMAVLSLFFIETHDMIIGGVWNFFT